MRFKKVISGYSDKLSVAPGEKIEFKVSVEDDADLYHCDIVRLFSTDEHALGPGLVESVVDVSVNQPYRSRRQYIHTGSYVRVPSMPILESFTLQAWIWPTLLGINKQTILAQGVRVSMELNQTGALTFEIGEERFTSDIPLLERIWAFIAVSYDAPNGTVRLLQIPQRNYPHIESFSDRSFTARRGQKFDGDVTIGAQGLDRTTMTNHFNGKIDRPRIANRALNRNEMTALAEMNLPANLASETVASWDFARETLTDQILDISKNQRHGFTINLPARAMIGHNWTGDVTDWRFAPDQYGAIHFHDSDLYDADWETDFTFPIPTDLESGVYAAKLTVHETPAEHVVFFVRPPRDRATAEICYLASTASYLAYANARNMDVRPTTEARRGGLIVVTTDDLFLSEHPEYGFSLYETHADGSGVCYSSRLRPILTTRPNMPLWGFNQDGYLLYWLHRLGFRADVITDEDLHLEGLSLISRYRTVVTGSHPEYWSNEMWDAAQAYVDEGGRLMYLGGNGFYWRIAFSDHFPGAIEHRRAEDGARSWAAEPGEYRMSFTGELSGLWRRSDRTPNQLVGVGFTAQGFSVGTYYVRQPDSFDPRARWIFDGVGAGERIGEFGFAAGGASGQELDRYDAVLGSPPHALVLATSEGHNYNMLLTNEEYGSSHLMITGDENPDVRSDMVFFETKSGGAVFSTGSISWIASLAWNDCDNNCSRVTRNVLERFLNPTPF